jgi:cytochrome P450
LWRLLPELTARPHQALSDLAARYGDVVLLNYPLDRTIILSNPADIEYLLHRRHQQYDKQTPRWRTLRQVWGDGLLTAERDVWRRQRQRMQPAFHQQGQETFAAVVVDEALKIRDEWQASARAGTPRDVYVDMLRCAVRAITRAAFGSDIERHTDMMVASVIDVNAYINPVSFANLVNLPFALRRWVSPGFGAYDRAMKQLQQLFRELIDRRRASDELQPDLLGMIMTAKDDETSQTMTVQQLYDEMMGILMAGHETTGIGTGWAWYWLSQYPGVQQKLQAEVDAVLEGRTPTLADFPKLQYTQMVFQEALRLTPSVYAIDRHAAEDDCLGGYRIPKGVAVVLSPYVMHHHPKYWRDPERFDPERFTPAASAERPAYAYFPFGGGPRRCIGMKFAMVEAVFFLAVLAQSFTVSLKPGHPVEPAPRLNLPPKHGIPMFFTERHRAPSPAGA